MTARTHSPDSEARRDGVKSGLVLAFALGILVLMAIMGVVILSNTRTELNITANNRLGREAFNSADATARMATFLTLALLNPRTDDINDVITSGASLSPSPRYPLYVCLEPKFNLEDLLDDATNFDYTKRYIETGASSKKAEPHIKFKLGPCGSNSSREVANAVVNLETYNLIPDGMGLGTGDPNDSASGPRLQVGVIVSVNAKTTESMSTNPSVTNVTNEPNSIVTIMYRNYMN
ncbi:MAG: hypothetical protein LBR80_16185 [Deltaproteobacteria bacterium]|jgi:hypothetical protein|nr:hypothetical protein [Deltaproteobacteria bacterium]